MPSEVTAPRQQRGFFVATLLPLDSSPRAAYLASHLPENIFLFLVFLKSHTMDSLSLRVIDSDTFIKVIKGEMVNVHPYSNFYVKNKKNDIDKIAVRFQNCEFEIIYLHEDFNYRLEITITNSKVKGIYIESGNFESLSLNNISVSNDSIISINGGHFKSFYMSGEIQCRTYLGRASFDSCYFGDTNFTQNVTIRDGTYEKIYLSGVKTKGLFIKGGEFNEFLLAGGAHLNDCDIFGLYFDGGRFQKAHIYGLSKITKIYVAKGFFNSLILASEGITEVEIGPSLDEDNSLNIGTLWLHQLGKINLFAKEVAIKLVNFSDCFLNKDAVFRFNEMRTGALNFRNVINYGQIAFNKLHLINRLSIEYSDLGKTTFINCDLASSDFAIESSKITDVFLAGTEMPHNIVGTTNAEMRSAYSQIKKIYENKGDSISAEEFFAKEINSYYKILTFKK